jgi:hypothetical protein
MKIALVTLVLLSIAFSNASAEEQVFDSSGRLLEIRQQYGDTSYAYDANRNPIYTATDVSGGKGVYDFRDKYGVHVGIGGPGTYPWAVRGTWGVKP